MSDRKYRQRGYQDEPRASAGRKGRSRAAPAAGARAGPRAAGRARPEDAEPDGRARSVPLRALRQPAVAAGRTLDRVLEVRRRSPQLHPVRVVRHQRALGVHARTPQLPARVAPKDERNTCALFTPRTTVERQTSTPAQQQPVGADATARSRRSTICSSSVAARDSGLAAHRAVRQSLVPESPAPVIISSMSLLSPADQEKLRDAFDEMTAPVRAAVLHADARLRDLRCRRGRSSTSCRRCPTRSRSRR